MSVVKFIERHDLEKTISFLARHSLMRLKCPEKITLRCKLMTFDYHQIPYLMVYV